MDTADFSVNDYVVYKGVGVCRIEAVETKSFDGVTNTEYFRLVPLNSESSSYFLPVSVAPMKLRRPMTEREVNKDIDNYAVGVITLDANSKERRNAIDSILREGDCTRIIRLIKTIYLHTQSCRSSGKKVLVSDENALRTAERMIYPEFSFVLGIDEKEVAGYIGKRLEVTARA